MSAFKLQRSRSKKQRETSPGPGKLASDDPSPPPPDGATAMNGHDVLKLKYGLEDLEMKKTIGTGTFGRVVLVRHKGTKDYFALKIMAISEVVRLKQENHVKNEKSVLQMIQHPFIIDMVWAHHDSRNLYMLLEFVCGGELFSYLRNAGHFSEDMCLFYTSEIVSALDYLHERNIVYRDLKPENLLLDREGHLKITDFGFAKVLLDRTWTLCGTPEYLAPEIIQSKGHNKAVDWWALGILIFEMLAGFPPFFDDNPFKIYEKILVGKIEFPKHIKNLVAKDLIKKLLIQDRTKRLGNMKSGTSDVKQHKYFRNVKWEDVYCKKLKAPIVPRVRHSGDPRNYYPEDWEQPPIVPKVAHEGDTSCFEEYPEELANDLPVPPKILAQFDDF